MQRLVSQLTSVSSSQEESDRISTIHNHESSKTSQIHWNSSYLVPGNVPNCCGVSYKLNSRDRICNAVFLRSTQNLQRVCWIRFLNWVIPGCVGRYTLTWSYQGVQRTVSDSLMILLTAVKSSTNTKPRQKPRMSKIERRPVARHFLSTRSQFWWQ